MSCSSDLLATGAQLRQDRVDAVLVDGAQRVRGNLQLDPAVFAGDPEAALVQVRQEAAAGLVVRMRDVVAGLHALAGDLAYAGHNAPRLVLGALLGQEGFGHAAGGPVGPWNTQRAAHYARRAGAGQPAGGRRVGISASSGPGASPGAGCRGTGCRRP